MAISVETAWEAQKYLVELRMKDPEKYKKFMENLEQVVVDNAKLARKVLDELGR